MDLIDFCRKNIAIPVTSSSAVQASVDGDNLRGGDGGAESAATPFMVVRMHWLDMCIVLDSAGSSMMRHAWIHGQPTPDATCRLVLRVSVDIPLDRSPNPSRDSRSGIWERMYAEAREYWRGKLGDESVSGLSEALELRSCRYRFD